MRSAAWTEDGRRRHRFKVTGVVQGVGFRPFVHRLAGELALTGFVGNDSAAVFVEVQGDLAAVDAFARRLRADAPPSAVITGLERTELEPAAETDFRIVASGQGEGSRTLVSPDIATCKACLGELFDPADRRYRHPFITCTDCGPRFTIIQDLPYDRPLTTMSGFAMCQACSGEYGDPGDRRFHAQPIACTDCGPSLWFECCEARIEGSDDALAAAQRALAAGSIVAVKGIGGYHLACRADDADAVTRLRERKSRNRKPFALLARDVDIARRLVRVDDAERDVLCSTARPIVLMRRRSNAPICEEVAPGNPLLGVMLPYTPILHLLLAPVPGADVPAPDVLVMTSANVSDEPLCFDDADARNRLPFLADAVLNHDRPIHVSCDDSVLRLVEGRQLPIRRSRGYVPLPVPLGQCLPATLAVGGELKNCCCLIDGSHAFCSAHIGDMGSFETTRAFERAVAQLTTLHRLQPEIIAADAHPAYLTRVWAEERSGAPGEPDLRFVQHHHAHVASLLAEHGRLDKPVIGVAFDGTGYGDDAAIWGGEILLLGTDTASYERAGHLLPVQLPGGDAAVRNPCRIALAYLDAADLPWADDLPPVAACSAAEVAAVRSQLRSGFGTVRCTSIGRLFDAVAALLGVRQRVGYEAEAAIELETLAGEAGESTPPLRFPVSSDGVLDYRPLLRDLVDGTRAGIPVADLAYAFHLAIAQAVTDVASLLSRTAGVQTVGLTGGVFQNVLLTKACRVNLESAGFEVLTHRLIPCNDGGLALGQAVVAALASRRPDDSLW